MKDAKPTKLMTLKLYNYTKNQLTVKEKLRLGIKLKNIDYLELYDDLLSEFSTLSMDNDNSVKYSEYLKSKYGLSIDFYFPLIKELITERLNNGIQ